MEWVAFLYGILRSKLFVSFLTKDFLEFILKHCTVNRIASCRCLNLQEIQDLHKFLQNKIRSEILQILDKKLLIFTHKNNRKSLIAITHSSKMLNV